MLYLMKCLITGWMALGIVFVALLLCAKLDDKFGEGFCIILTLTSVVAIMIGSIILECVNLFHI